MKTFVQFTAFCLIMALLFIAIEQTKRLKAYNAHYQKVYGLNQQAVNYLYESDMRNNNLTQDQVDVIRTIR